MNPSSSLSSDFVHLTPESNDQFSEDKAEIGARKVSRLLLTYTKPLTLKEIKSRLGDKSIQNLTLLNRYIEKATNKNWIHTSRKSGRNIRYKATPHIRLLEASLDGKIDEVKGYYKDVHNFNYWIKSVNKEHQENELCPLMAGIESGNQAVVRHLEDQGALFPDPPDSSTGNNILHHLAKTNYIKSACKAISQNPELLLKENSEQKKPIDIATYLNNESMVRILKNQIDLQKKKQSISILQKNSYRYLKDKNPENQFTYQGQ